MTVSVNKLKTKKAHSTYLPADFDLVFQDQWTRIYGVVYRIVGDHAEAEDLALETFLRLHQKPPRDQTNIIGWLYRVATNKALNALRSRGRRGGYEAEAGLINLEKVSSIDPAAEAERTEDRRRVRQVLSRMRKRSAKILILRYSGFSYSEIAKTVGLSPSSIGTMLARAESDFKRRYGSLGQKG